MDLQLNMDEINELLRRAKRGASAVQRQEQEKRSSVNSTWEAPNSFPSRTEPEQFRRFTTRNTGRADERSAERTSA